MTTGDPAWRRLADAGVYGFLAVVCFLILVPIYWIVATSFKPTSEILVTPTSIITMHPTLDHYRIALGGDFRRYLLNSLIAASGSTALGFLLAVPAAWGFAKHAYPGSSMLLSFAVVTRVFPPIALALPFFLQFRAIGLIDNPLGLVIGYLPIVLPLMIWILTGFFRDFPNELVDAARIDGLGTLGILIRVVMPHLPPRLGSGDAVRLSGGLERVCDRADDHPHTRRANHARRHIDPDHAVPDAVGRNDGCGGHLPCPRTRRHHRQPAGPGAWADVGRCERIGGTFW